jgi:hypothetical protein
VVEYTEEGNEEAEKYRDFAIRVYLLILDDYTIFANKSMNNVYLT